MLLLLLQGKHVLVIGAGKTAIDVAVTVSEVAASSTILARKGHVWAPQWVLGRWLRAILPSTVTIVLCCLRVSNTRSTVMPVRGLHRTAAGWAQLDLAAAWHLRAVLDW